MANKRYLDETGVTHLWGQIGKTFADKTTYFSGTKAKGSLDSDKLGGKTSDEIIAAAKAGLADNTAFTKLSTDVDNLKKNFNTNGHAKEADLLGGKNKTEIVNEARSGLAVKADLDSSTTRVTGDILTNVTMTDGVISGTKITKASITSGLAAQSSLDTVSKKVTDLEGKFTGNKANDADKLDGQHSTYFAKATDVTALDSKVKALSSATHFIGVKESLPTVSTGKKGDIVVIVDKTSPIDPNNGKEFIYSGEDGKGEWIELGDTTDERNRLTALEDKFTDTKAKDADKLDGQNSDYFAKASDVTTLKSYFEGGVAKTAKVANSVETSARQAIINDARSGYETAATAKGKYAAKAIENNFTGDKANKALNADKVNGLTVETAVPKNAVFTDTHYTTHIYAGAGDAANAVTTNGSTKITVADNTTVRGSVIVKGTGATKVTSDTAGVITINSTDSSTAISATGDDYITATAGGSGFNRSVSVTADVCTNISNAAATQLADAAAVKEYCDTLYKDIVAMTTDQIDKAIGLKK